MLCRSPMRLHYLLLAHRYLVALKLPLQLRLLLHQTRCSMITHYEGCLGSASLNLLVSRVINGEHYQSADRLYRLHLGQPRRLRRSHLVVLLLTTATTANTGDAERYHRSSQLLMFSPFLKLPFKP